MKILTKELGFAHYTRDKDSIVTTNASEIGTGITL